MPTTRPKILLVDDVDFFLDIERGFLARTPAEILTAKSGAEALRLIRQERPQLVYLDVTLPDLNGAECCRQVKTDPFLRLTPVVLIFASAQELADDAAARFGCDESLAKPLERKAFLNCGYRYLFGVERRNPRIPCHVPVRCQFENEALESRVLDVSSHGVYVQSRQPVLPGTRVAVSFQLPAHEITIEGRGRIAWVNQGHQRNNPDLPQGFGVHLMQIHPSTQACLEDFVGKEAERDAIRHENTLLSRDNATTPAPAPNQQTTQIHDDKKESGWTEH